MGGASIGAGRVISTPLFYTVRVRGYINSLQLFSNTTCLQSCNVVFPALCQQHIVYSRDGTGSPGHGSPGQQFGSGSGRVTGQSSDPDFDPGSYSMQ